MAGKVKLTKAQRLKLVTADDRAKIDGMSNEYLLAFHDLLHEQMEIRSGSHKRAALSQQTGSDNE